MATSPASAPSTSLAARQPRQDGLIAQMASRLNLTPAVFYDTIKATLMPNKGQGVTNEQVAAFLVVANEYDLDPFRKEIFAFPANGGIQPVVSIDGWCAIINRHPKLDGITFEDHHDASGGLSAITCRIHRQDRTHPVEVTEYLAECKRDTEPWKKWPARMLRHKSLIQCARYAFALSGILDPDEAERLADAPAPPRRMPDRLSDYARKPATIGLAAADVEEATTQQSYSGIPATAADAADEIDPSDFFDDEGSAYEPASEPAPRTLQSAPATAPGPVISEARARRFYAIARQASKENTDIDGYLKNTIGVSRKEDIPVSRYEEACQWAETR